jgi:hypothetical protein
MVRGTATWTSTSRITPFTAFGEGERTRKRGNADGNPRTRALDVGVLPPLLGAHGAGEASTNSSDVIGYRWEMRVSGKGKRGIGVV